MSDLTNAAHATVADQGFELGVYSFAELTPDPATGAMISPAERLQNLVETIELADQVGLDVFGIGEHHRPEFVSSAPVVILAAAAARTQDGPHPFGRVRGQFAGVGRGWGIGRLSVAGCRRTSAVHPGFGAYGSFPRRKMAGGGS